MNRVARSRRFRRERVVPWSMWLRLAFGLAIVLATLIGAAFAPAITSHLPQEQDLTLRLLPPGANPAYLLGTDALGRDIASRLLYGARVSLLVGVLAVVIQGGVGVPLGIVSAYYGKRWDSLIMRFADVQLAIPVLVLAIAILGSLGPDLVKLIVVLGLTGWVTYARVARASTLSLRSGDLIAAAQAIGASDHRILLRHVLPNIGTSLIVIGTQQVAAMILAEAALGYLGLSVPPPTPTWGGMVVDGRDYLAFAWHVSTIPGMAILALVLSVNLLGDALSDWLNPLTRVQL